MPQHNRSADELAAFRQQHADPPKRSKVVITAIPTGIRELDRRALATGQVAVSEEGFNSPQVLELNRLLGLDPAVIKVTENLGNFFAPGTVVASVSATDPQPDTIRVDIESGPLLTGRIPQHEIFHRGDLDERSAITAGVRGAIKSEFPEARRQAIGSRRPQGAREINQLGDQEEFFASMGQIAFGLTRSPRGAKVAERLRGDDDPRSRATIAAYDFLRGRQQEE